MKSILLLTAFGFLYLGSLTCNAQNIEFKYDNAGNRISRYVINLKHTSAKDSTKLIHNDLLNGVTVLIKPNPSGGKFDIELQNFDHSINASYYLFTTGGKLIRQTRKMKTITKIDIANQANGLYILKILINGKPRTWKIIKE